MDSSSSSLHLRNSLTPLLCGDAEPNFTGFCFTTACRLTVVYPAVIVVSFPLCRIWALLIIACWLFSGRWKERLALFRENVFLFLTILYLLFAAAGVFYSTSTFSEAVKEWHGRQTMIVVPVIASLLFRRPERRTQMFAVFNFSVFVALIVYFFLFLRSGVEWSEFLAQRTIYLFKNNIGTGMALVLWTGLWICSPFVSREIPWIRSRLSAVVLESLSAASRLHPWEIVREVVRQRLPWQTILFSAVRWGAVGSVAVYLFCINPSRTAQLALCLSLGVLLFAWNFRQGILYFLLFVFVVFPLAYTLSPFFSEKVNKGVEDLRMFTNAYRSGDSTSLKSSSAYRKIGDGRLLLYYDLARKIKEKPLFGYGMGFVEHICLRSGTKWVPNPHNEFLCVGIQSGLIGLSLFLLWLGAIFFLSFGRPSPWKYLGLFFATALIVDSLFNCSLSFCLASRYFGLLFAALFVADAHLRPSKTKYPFRFDVPGPEQLLQKLEFVREVDKLKQVLRRNGILGGERLENAAEHSWHIAVMAMLFAQDAKTPSVDLLRVLKMLLVHDLVEIDAGDTYAFDVAGHRDKAERERAAAQRLFALLPEKEGDEFRRLWEEFDAEETPDAMFALALDRLQPMLQNYLQGGVVWKYNGISPEQVRARLESLRETIPELGKIADAIVADAVNRGYFPLTSFAVVLAAAGKSRRFGSGSIKKPFVSLAGKPVWLHSAERFAARDDVRQLIVVVSPEDEQWFRDEYAEEIQRLNIDVVRGGAERFESVQRALDSVWESIDYVAVHDAARPCVSAEAIDAVFQAVRRHGAAMLAAPVVGTVKRIDDDRIVETVPREVLWEAQTPQVFERRLLLNAYAERYGHPTDDAQLVERLGRKVFVVSGDRRNIKITTQEDFDMLQRMLSETVFQSSPPAGEGDTQNG